MSETPDGKNCTVFGRCGGCTSLDVPYMEQLSSKDDRVSELFEGVCDPEAICPIIGMEDPFHYRNKVIAPFVWGRPGRDASGPAVGAAKPSRSGRASGLHGKASGIRNGARKGARKGLSRPVASGMYARGTHKVIEAQGCLLENPVASEVVEAVKSIMLRHAIEPYDEDSGKGFLRHAVVRIGHSSGEVMVTLVTNSDEFPHAKAFCRELVGRVPAVTTVVQSVNKRQTNVVMGERTNVLYGPGFILDRICGCSFRVSPEAFYQVNARQTEVLYETAVEMAGVKGGELVVDAYCGTGTIGLAAVAASGLRDIRLVGVDCSVSAIRDARQNARHNGVDNAEFLIGDATEFLKRASSNPGFSQGRPAVLFMDPPRAGATPEFLQAIAHLRPGRIVYISCNPVTQARDARLLVDAGYEVVAVQPVDMFPHTPHIECVMLLKARETGNYPTSENEEGRPQGGPTKGGLSQGGLSERGRI